MGDNSTPAVVPSIYASESRDRPGVPSNAHGSSSSVPGEIGKHTILPPADVERYSRQLLWREGERMTMGARKGSVLVVGAGGLGCPAIMYLAGAGIGRLGIADLDVVELSNLHRQVAHNEGKVGMSKVESAASCAQQLNSGVVIERHSAGLQQHNAVTMVGGYDVVLDCTDNALTRYLLSDACVIAGVPLVSGAAISAEGQLSVYNLTKESPCYRCVFPEAPGSGSCKSCDEAGVLGPVPGVIGVLQALEALKILGKVGTILDRKLLLFDAMSMRNHVVKLRGRNKTCIAHTMTPSDLKVYDYITFTGQMACPGPLRALESHQRMSANDFSSMRARSTDYLLVDVRPPQQYAMARLEPSINMPFTDLADRIEDVKTLSKDKELILLCRRGNDSQDAAHLLIDSGLSCKDISGGLLAWRAQVDPEFPLY